MNRSRPQAARQGGLNRRKAQPIAHGERLQRRRGRQGASSGRGGSFTDCSGFRPRPQPPATTTMNATTPRCSMRGASDADRRDAGHHRRAGPPLGARRGIARRSRQRRITRRDADAPATTPRAPASRAPPPCRDRRKAPSGSQHKNTGRNRSPRTTPPARASQQRARCTMGRGIAYRRRPATPAPGPVNGRPCAPTNIAR